MSGGRTDGRGGGTCSPGKETEGYPGTSSYPDALLPGFTRRPGNFKYRPTSARQFN